MTDIFEITQQKKMTCTTGYVALIFKSIMIKYYLLLRKFYIFQTNRFRDEAYYNLCIAKINQYEDLTYKLSYEMAFCRYSIANKLSKSEIRHNLPQKGKLKSGAYIGYTVNANRAVNGF